MSVPTELAELLQCPGCAAYGLLRRASAWHCAGCETVYPEIDGVPFLFPEPALALGEWRLRQQRLITELRQEASQQREALARTTGAAARNRLKFKAAGLEDHARRLAALLAPLGVEEAAPALETQRALGTPLPDAAGLAAYYVNVHRDWCWGTEENEASLEAVMASLEPAAPQRVLVLGAGAGRLAYDIHQRLAPRVVVALDVNPLFGLLARRLYAGGRVELYEFPIAPRDVEALAILRTLQAPAPARPGLEVVLADATRAPFAPGSFDLVVTPWLIDVLDIDFAAFAPRVNALLRDGGRWVNTGSLAFAQSDPALHYALGEVLEIVAACGFAPPVVSERRVSYLCSPASRHGRVETVVTFGATRRTAVTVPPAAALPPWLERTDLPVPALPAYQSAALAMRVYGYVASLIDGRRSAADIAAVLVHDRLMTAQSAPAAVRGFLHRMHEDAARRTKF